MNGFGGGERSEGGPGRRVNYEGTLRAKTTEKFLWVENFKNQKRLNTPGEKIIIFPVIQVFNIYVIPQQNILLSGV